jgi:hypothetical protein
MPIRAGRPAEANEAADPAKLVAAALAGYGRPPIIEGLAEGPGRVRWLEFRRGVALGACLDFPEPVTGPIVADCPLPGFGLFLCEEDER